MIAKIDSEIGRMDYKIVRICEDIATLNELLKRWRSRLCTEAKRDKISNAIFFSYRCRVWNRWQRRRGIGSDWRASRMNRWCFLSHHQTAVVLLRRIAFWVENSMLHSWVGRQKTKSRETKTNGKRRRGLSRSLPRECHEQRRREWRRPPLLRMVIEWQGPETCHTDHLDCGNHYWWPDSNNNNTFGIDYVCEWEGFPRQAFRIDPGHCSKVYPVSRCVNVTLLWATISPTCSAISR